jgi:AcrR family transcriptional regulator
MQTERQTEIIDCSIEIIDKKGIQGLTIKNISKEIGISEPAIYRHFKSKTDIILAILDNFMLMAEFLSGAMDNYEGEAIEKISFMFSKMLEMFNNQPSIVSVIFSEEIFKNEESLLIKIREILNLHQQTIEKIITKGQKEGNVRSDIDKNSLALIIMGALRLLVKRWDLNQHNFNLENEGDTLIQSFKLIINKN